MFTGIITGIGILSERTITASGGRFAIDCGYDAATIALGASIAHDGCCLTVTSLIPNPKGCRYTLDVSNETLSKTMLGSWQPGQRINLERALKIGDELGGHIVSGHIDGLARILDIKDDGDSRRFRFEVPPTLAPLIASKGSVALDGASLTVNEVSGNTFGINIIPHTLTVTTWGAKNAGDLVNLEVDMLARHVARLLEFRQ